MSFHIGQEVVCVDDTSPPVRGDWSDKRTPRKGEHFTVSAIGTDLWTGLTQIQLFELPGVSSEGIMLWYRASRFRPIHKTDISIFIKMLEPIGELV